MRVGFSNVTFDRRDRPTGGAHSASAASDFRRAGPDHHTVADKRASRQNASKEVHLEESRHGKKKGDS